MLFVSVLLCSLIVGSAAQNSSPKSSEDPSNSSGGTVCGRCGPVLDAMSGRVAKLEVALIKLVVQIQVLLLVSQSYPRNEIRLLRSTQPFRGPMTVGRRTVGRKTGNPSEDPSHPFDATVCGRCGPALDDMSGRVAKLELALIKLAKQIKVSHTMLWK